MTFSQIWILHSCVLSNIADISAWILLIFENVVAETSFHEIYVDYLTLS